MKNIIEVRFVQTVAGRSKKTGNDYDMRMAQCVVHKLNHKTNIVEPLVGVLALPDQYKELARGVYEVEFDVGLNRAGRIGSEIALISPVSSGKSSAPASPLLKSHVEIINVVPLSGRSKAGNDYDMRLAQCFVHKTNRETGVIEEFSGELLLPERYKEIAAGMYDVEFEIAIDRDKRVGSQVFSIVPVVPAARPAQPAPVQPKAA